MTENSSPYMTILSSFRLSCLFICQFDSIVIQVRCMPVCDKLLLEITAHCVTVTYTMASPAFHVASNSWQANCDKKKIILLLLKINIRLHKLCINGLICIAGISQYYFKENEENPTIGWTLDEVIFNSTNSGSCKTPTLYINSEMKYYKNWEHF